MVKNIDPIVRTTSSFIFSLKSLQRAMSYIKKESTLKRSKQTNSVLLMQSD